MNASTQQESTALAVVQPSGYDLSPRNFEEAWRMAEYLADSQMVPKDFQGKPANCLIAIQWGAELGIKTMQAIQNIAVINGRPSLWGDVMLALVRNSPLCEYVVEEVFDERAVCRVKRRGEPEQVREFTKSDAERASLWGKTGPWQQYKKRMLQMRARGWALRDVFTDVLKGLSMAEEAMDMTPAEKHMGAADVVGAPPAPPAPPPPAAETLPEFTLELVQQRASKIAEFYSKGKTADDIIKFYSLKSHLSEAVQKAIRDMAPAKAADVTDAQPKATYAEVADKLEKAADRDALYVAADLIKAVSDEQQRAELTSIFERRDADFS